ncbi:MAG: hypothetical protein AAF830_08470 [Pseudomonadota bacterium]
MVVRPYASLAAALVLFGCAQVGPPERYHCAEPGDDAGFARHLRLVQSQASYRGAGDLFLEQGRDGLNHYAIACVHYSAEQHAALDAAQRRGFVEGYGTGFCSPRNGFILPASRLSACEVDLQQAQEFRARMLVFLNSATRPAPVTPEEATLRQRYTEIVQRAQVQSHPAREEAAAEALSLAEQIDVFEDARQPEVRDSRAERARLARMCKATAPSQELEESCHRFFFWTMPGAPL